MTLEAEPRASSELSSIRPLHALTQAVSVAPGVEAIYAAALACLSQSLGVKRASILLFDPDRVMRFKAWLGLSDEYRKAVEGHTPWTPETENAQPVLVPNVFEDSSLKEYESTFAAEDITALAFIPLVANSRLLGKFMLYYAEKHEFREDEVLLAQTIASQVAFAIFQHNSKVELLERQQNLLLFREIFENSREGIAIIDPQGYYGAQNPAHAHLTGYESEELDGRTPAIHLGKETFEQIAAELQAGGFFRGEVKSTTKDGRHLILDLSAFSVKDETGQVRYHVGIKRDITERKQAEEALHRSLEVRDQFLSLVSHELRTPISTILGNGLLLLHREDRISPEDRHHAYADIVSEARKLQENVEHLLLLTKLEAGDIDVEEFSLADLGKSCVESFKEQNPGRSIELVSRGELPRVLGQQTLVSLVLQNFLTNAAKYSNEDSRIEVWLEPSDDGTAQVRVRDYGIGLDAKDLEGLFNPFFRSSRAREKATGMGLGLAVCKRAIEVQGGRIGARAASEKGSEFFFSLPCAGSQTTS